MKRFYLGPLVLLLCVVAHAEASSTEFISQKIELPDLSLKESTRRPIPFAQPVQPSPTARLQLPLVSKDRFVISPNPDVAYKLLIKQPDPDVDYKLIVKSVAPALKK